MRFTEEKIPHSLEFKSFFLYIYKLIFHIARFTFGTLKTSIYIYIVQLINFIYIYNIYIFTRVCPYSYHR